MTDDTEKGISVPPATPSIPQYAWRREEIRKLLAIPADEFLQKYRSRLQIADSLERLYEVFAELLAQEIEGNTRDPHYPSRRPDGTVPHTPQDNHREQNVSQKLPLLLHGRVLL